MQRLPLKQKVAKMLPFLQKAGLVSDPPPCEVGPKLTRIVEASGDRLKTAGDILAYADFFFVPDDKLAYDEKDFQKRVAPPQAKELLTKFRDVLAAVEPFEVAPARRSPEEVRRAARHQNRRHRPRAPRRRHRQERRPRRLRLPRHPRPRIVPQRRIDPAG